MKDREVRGTTVRQHDAAEATIVRFAHRRVDADLGSHPTHQECLYAAIAQHELEISLAESPLSRLVDDGLACNRIKLRDDVVARLTADQDAAHGPNGADTQCRVTAIDLQWRRIGQVGSMPFARMNNEDSRLAGRS